MRRGVRLTERGAAYFHRVSRAFEAVSNATKEIRHTGVPRSLRLAVPPHLLSGWMIQRLPRFLEISPVKDLRIVDTVRRVDFDSEDIDAQIMWGTGTWSGLELDLLVDDKLCVVCSPKFLEEFGPITSVQDLAGCPLIHTDRRPVNWERVLGSARVERLPRARNLVVLRPMPAVQAALRGMGAAIVSRICVADLLTSGSLVVPFEHQFHGVPNLAYFLARAQDAAAQSKVAYFRDWLRTELSRTLERQGTRRDIGT